jgi:hypothetical protein
MLIKLVCELKYKRRAKLWFLHQFFQINRLEKFFLFNHENQLKKFAKMKLSVGVLLSVLAVVAVAEESISRFVIAPDSLFENAREYQGKLQALQLDIDEQLTAIRTSVSTVLKSSSNVTLEQIESNANAILAQDTPTRDAIFALRRNTLCVNNLITLINGITEFTGFGSSNCVSTYDKSVQGALNTAYALLQKYEGSFGDVQQIVTRSFIKFNVYTQSDEIEAKFIEHFNKAEADWTAARPEVAEFVRTLSGNIAVFNTALGACFTKIQQAIAPAYGLLEQEIDTCNVFDSTPDPFAIYRV